jgi:hypothetical protein
MPTNPAGGGQKRLFPLRSIQEERMRSFFLTLFAGFVMLLPVRAEAQFFSHHQHWNGGGYWDAQSFGFGFPPPIAPMPCAPRPIFAYAPPIMSYAPSVAYTAPMPMFAQAQAPITFSTFRVDELVSSCRLRDGGRIEICDGFQILDPQSRDLDTIVLRQIANLLLWGWGYSVVARFTLHADGTVEAIASATPIAAGYIFQSVSGQGPTTAHALESALTRLTANMVR